MRRFLIVVASFFFKIIYPFKIYNKPKKIEGGGVVCCNHYKASDFLYMFNLTERPVSLIAKKEAFNNKFIAFILKKFKAIPINRDGNDLKALMECTKRLKNNELIGVFPEGTRNRTEQDLLPLKSGFVYFAIKSKTPIIPMMQCNRPRAFRKTRLMVGEPIYFTEFYDKKCTSEDFDKCSNILKESMLNLKEKYITLNSTKEGKKLLRKM